MDRVGRVGIERVRVKSGMGRRGLLGGGLGLVFKRSGAFWWVYAFNVLLAVLFSLRFGAQVGDVLNHSLNSQRVGNGFDLSVVADTLFRIGQDAPSTGNAGSAGTALYLLLYFVLVPGTLFCFQTLAPSKLSTMLREGLLHFWPFVRITILAAIVFGLVLGPLFALQNAWTKHVDERLTGYAALGHEAPLWLLILLIAGLLRLYFDLIEGYTVQLGLSLKPNGKPDRRVRRTLLPAFRTLFLRGNLWRTYGMFLLLTVLGLVGWAVTWWVGIHTLAQPRVWPLIVLGQLGIFLLLLSRVWQRGAETMLTQDFPIAGTSFAVDRYGVVEPASSGPRSSAFVQAGPTAGANPIAEVRPVAHASPTAYANPMTTANAISQPEPASPSLAEPDPDIYLQ